MSGGWYLAPSLAVLRQEINARWPNRDRTSDGTIGDEAHAKTKSDHNPNERGSVNAVDITGNGVDMAAILAAVERHPSAHYWIWQRQIADADDGWRPRAYTGSNPHTKHGHISIRQSAAAEQDRRPWGLLAEQEDDVALTAQQSKQLAAIDARVRALVGGAESLTTEWAANPKAVEPVQLVRQLSRIEATLTQALGRDLVDEEQIVRGVLDGLGRRPVEQAAAALRAVYEGREAELAQLAALLTSAGQASSE